MNRPAHKNKGVKRTKTVRFYRNVFTGKERDEETGYGYFGARYMDHELMTMWLSVDPMSDKYPSMSPYSYCAWNPMKLVDPDGREIVISEKDWEVLEFTLIQALGKDQPFFYDAATGTVRYDEAKMEAYQFSENTKQGQRQSDILEHYKELSCNENFTVNVKIIGNDEKFHAIVDGVEGDYTLKSIGANGFCQLNQDGAGCTAYVSSMPLAKDNRKYPQWEDHQAVSMNHEVGGHSYYYMLGLKGYENNKETTHFDNLYRKAFGKGAHGSGYAIRWSEAQCH